MNITEVSESLSGSNSCINEWVRGAGLPSCTEFPITLKLLHMSMLHSHGYQKEKGGGEGRK